MILGIIRALDLKQPKIAGTLIALATHSKIFPAMSVSPPKCARACVCVLREVAIFLCLVR